MEEKHKENPKHSCEEDVRQFVEAQLRGEQPDLNSLIGRYPDLEEQIRRQIQSFQCVNSLFDALGHAQETEFEDQNTMGDLLGQRIGKFEIEKVIGRGGMGVVYLARDTKLDRSVAIKRLPAELQASSTARTRFTREAKLLASLSHPNIGVIHDIIEPAEGSAYLVLEYIPGETLTERMAREPLRLEDALSMALQIAQAVSAAHEEGVIHRDLKPSNIKITPDGRVKVLDFGLAKTSVRKNAGDEPTITQAGRVMGTPAYMSPEQARGKPMDRRTDIWSFGCLLYEMLTGYLPFEGETTTDILARIIEREPDWGRLPPSTPSNIRVMLRRCLAKEPHRRLQHMDDAALEIDETLSLPADELGISELVAGISRRTLWWVGAICSVAWLTIGLIVASMFLGKPTGPSPTTVAAVPTRRTVIRLPENQVLGLYQSTTFANREPAFALSPDGSRFVYVARVGDMTQLFERRMDQFEVRLIPGTEGAFAPFFSPDGQSVGFFAGADMKVISLLGGEPVTLCSTRDYSGGSWGSDGMIYFFRRGEGLSRVPAAGGNVEPLGIEFDTLGAAGYPQVLPGNKAVLVSSADGAVLVSLETMETKILFKDVRYARYVPTGHLVYVRAGSIEAVPFNPATLDVSGRPAPVLNGVLLDSGVGTAQLAFSDDGLLVYAPGSDTCRTIPSWIDRQGNVEPIAMPADIYGALKLSPDGRRLAILAHELQSNIYIFDIARQTKIQLTLEGDNSYPLWTPDGKGMVFCCRTGGEEDWNLLLAPADGSGEPELLCSSKSKLAPRSWSPDSKLLALYSLDSDDADIWVLPLEGPRELELLLGTECLEVGPSFSPDGRWIAYNSDRDGEFQIYVRPYPVMDRVIQISREFGEEPIWSANGDELFYRNRDKWMVVSISTEPEFSAGTPQVLFQGPYGNVPGLSYDVAPDGQRFLVLKPQYDDSQVRELHVVTNWFEELKRLVPTE